MVRGRDEERALILGIEGVEDYAIFLLDTDGHVITWNRGAQRIKGYEASEIVGQHFRRFYVDEDVRGGKCERLLELARAHGRCEDEGWRCRKDGSRFWANAVITAVRGEDGEVTGFVKVTRDLTERIRAEEEHAQAAALRANLDRMRLLAESSTVFAAGALDLDGTLSMLVRRCAEILGDGCALVTLTEQGDEAVVRAFHHVDPSALELARQMFVDKTFSPEQSVAGQVLLSGAQVLEPVLEPEVTLARAMPEAREWVLRYPIHSVLAVPLRASQRLLGALVLSRTTPGRPYTDDDRTLIQDLADRGSLALQNATLYESRVRALAEASRSRAQFEATFQSMQDGVTIFDMRGNLVLANDAFARISGFASSELLRRDLDQFFELYEMTELDGSPLPLERWPVSRIARGETLSELEYKATRRDTGQRWFFAFSGAPVHDEHGRQVLSVVITRDITRTKRAEQRLRASERKFSTIFHQAPVALVLVRFGSGQIVDCNRAWVRLLGYSREEAIGKTTLELDLYRDAAARQRMHEEFHGTGSAGGFDVDMVTKTGQPLMISMCTDLVELDGAQYVLGTATNVTERKRAESALRESERRFRFLADNLPQLVWTANPDGEIDYYNRRWREFTGLLMSPGGEPSWLPIVHPDDAERCVQAWRHSVETGEIYQIECRLRAGETRDYRWFLARAVPLLDDAGHVAKWFGTSTDIHDSKETEQRLTESLQVRDEFLAIAGHELKTPLAALLMHVQSLERVVRPDDSAPRLRERLDKVSATGRRLESLILQLLDVSRITAGRLKLELEPVRLDELVCEVADRFRDEAERVHSPLGVYVAGAITGRWDRLRIDQVITNLLANAIKYGKGSPVQIAVRREDGAAVLQVSDGGIGIAPDQQQRIFERFERAVGTREYGGFGLGLWITRQVVEASGGEISVDSALGKGATFTVRLPLESRREGHGVTH